MSTKSAAAHVPTFLTFTQVSLHLAAILPLSTKCRRRKPRVVIHLKQFPPTFVCLQGPIEEDINILSIFLSVYYSEYVPLVPKWTHRPTLYQLLKLEPWLQPFKLWQQVRLETLVYSEFFLFHFKPLNWSEKRRLLSTDCDSTNERKDVIDSVAT